MVLDTTDRKLLALLAANARESVAELARKLGLGRSTVHERIAKLERRGVIVGYSTTLSRGAVVQSTRVLVMMTIQQRAQNGIMEQLRRMPEILSCHTVSGDDDLALMIEAPQLEDVDAVLDEIVRLPGVERCRSCIIMGTLYVKNSARSSDIL